MVPHPLLLQLIQQFGSGHLPTIIADDSKLTRVHTSEVWLLRVQLRPTPLLLCEVCFNRVLLDALLVQLHLRLVI